MTDSWVEIPSGASTASILSSANPPSPYSPVSRNVSNLRRRGRATNPSPLHLQLPPRPSSIDGSSQEEYEESESESDRLMTSSNEALQSSASESEPRRDNIEPETQEDERIETATAFGIATDQNCFTPQPNAFTHPPSSQLRHRSSVPESYFPSASRTSASAHRHSYPGQQQRQNHSPSNAISPNHQPDHDAALRASLTTLLSLGAAARGLPKNDQPSNRIQALNNITRGDTISMRTVPESVALGLDRPTLQPRRVSSTPSSSNPAPSPAVDSFALRLSEHQHSDRQKRKAVRSSSKDRDKQRVVKKPRRLIIEDGVSPTLLTWVVSAGVLVLVSALSFSAGYKVGQETARLETGFNATESGSCAKEATRTGMGLRRLRWSSAANAVSV